MNRLKRNKIKRLEKKITFSKMAYVSSFFLAFVTAVFTFYIVYVTRDSSPLAYLIPAVFAEYATATGFYYNKSKLENKIKLMSAFKIKPDNDDFNNF